MPSRGVPRTMHNQPKVMHKRQGRTSNRKRPSRRALPTRDSQLRVMRKRRGGILHRSILKYADLFNLDVILMAQDRSSGEYEVFEPNENWPPHKRHQDVSKDLESALQQLEKLVIRTRAPKPPQPQVLRS
ncbi:uncharacterized protein BCR38DRAFT_408925 [Pseudomassariella vexata]|uniref:Uncharacterized protein n=1 Tax=Pseudomassariella vexata TaxID=1141098 RepID=A0A1Y2E1K1_9PEZI|nr:uncharacterized protein BCR38DRAFT_408925 [Pseudomassariella vexata]ORY65196.1 hypothetical protein BCR38DRAFT_408925 [Pseudomassariella vexata]